MFESHAASTDSRQIRVFLSSTFVDFMEERELLVKRVFPALNRRARDRGVELIDVDLRWGVTEEQTKQGLTLPLCLGEIDRCRPYFIGLLGERHGWVPPADFYKPELLERQPWLRQHKGGASVTELEILHGVLRNPEMAGHAFFYLRDPAYALAKKDPTWLAEGEEDRQRLQALKEQVRASRFPVVEGLSDPEAIASRIEADLWELIEERFPEQEQPDALKQENRKHASYRHSRTSEGQYIGGESYIEQLKGWIQEDEQQILISGPSGSGKSALLANWMAAHAQAHPEDVVYAHHLGCTNDANALQPMLARLIQNASLLLLNEEIITEELVIPQDWWDLVAKVAETLQNISRWCKKTGRRWIWVLDGLDRLVPNDQKALPWLPQNLPAGVQVVASALVCQARTILSERGYPTLTIEPLTAGQQEQLIQRYLQRYTKELDCGLRQQILGHTLAGSPLFLKVLLEELRQCGRHDTLKEQLDLYLSSQTIDNLYERVLERLENDGSGEAVKKVMTAIWGSRAGLSETELLAITELAPLQWAPIDLALEKAFGRNGNRLVFDHDFLRTAVQDSYLPSEEQQRQAHSVLADWFRAQAKWDERKAEEWPWQLQQAERKYELRDLLLNTSNLFELAEVRDDREVINYWLAVKANSDRELDELIADDLDQEIEKRRDNPENLIGFTDHIADLLDEAGLYRESFLKLRMLSLELAEASKAGGENGIFRRLAWLAEANRLAGNYNAASPFWERCLEIAERSMAPGHPETLSAINNLGLVNLEKRDFNESRAYLERALEAGEKSLGPEDLRLTPILNNLALLHQEEGKHEKAVELLKRCIETNRQQLGPGARAGLANMCNLANLYREQGCHAEAMSLCSESLSQGEKLLGKEHPDLCASLNLLALLYSDTGTFEEASKVLERALSTSLRLLGEDHPQTLDTISNLASICGEQGNHDKAEALARQELAARMRLSSSSKLEVLESKAALANILRLRGCLIEAEHLYRDAYEGMKRVAGAHWPTTRSTLLALAGVLTELGRYKEAIMLRREELLISRETSEKDDVILEKTKWLAEDLRYNGQLNEAEELLREILNSRVNNLVADQSDGMSIVYSLAEVLSAQKRHAESIPLRQHELAWCREQNGDTDPGTLASINALAIDLRENGALEEAEALFRELVAARLHVLEPEDFQIGRALGGLAKSLEEAGKLEEAFDYSQQALDHRLAHEGPDALWTNRERLDLARVLHKLERHTDASALLNELQESMVRNNDPYDDDPQLISDAEELMRAIEEP